MKKNVKKTGLVKESADLLRRVNNALHNFVVSKPSLLTEIEPSQELKLEELIGEWEKYASSETTPSKSSPDYDRIMNMRKDVEEEILSIIEQPSDIDDYDIDEEMEMSERKHVMSFSEMLKLQEKITLRIPSNSKVENNTNSDRNRVNQVKSEINQKLKQLDTILATSEPTVTIETEPVRELLERLNFLFKKIK